MAFISLPASQAQWSDSHFQNQSRDDYAQPPMSRPERIPNPPFQFPARDPESTDSSEATPRNPPPLPAFSFPQAPVSTSPSSQQPHRRGHSTIAGGSSSNTAATGSNNDIPPPSFLPPPGPGLSGRGPGRRSHAHRRSAAISSVDLNAISKAFPPIAVGSGAPGTPTEVTSNQMTKGEVDRIVQRNSPRTPTVPSMGQVDPSKLAPPPPVPVLFEPSTERSENNTSTIPPSIQSELPKEDLQSVRPKTANATLNLGEESSGNSGENTTARRPVSASASIAPVGRASTDAPDVPPLPRGQFGILDSGTPQPATRAEIPSRAASEKKPGKKKKMRAWAGMLTRKGKKRAPKKAASSRKGPTPPVLSRTNSEIGSLYGLNFDEDNTIIIRTPTQPNAPQTQASNEPDSFEASWKPRSFYEQGRESDMFSPVIDLDAALGPFNTPEMGTEQCSGFSIATKRMYSGGRRGQFVGPEMRYHRRAESAPEMPPFDRSALPRFIMNSNPDVFDEEEEDAFLAQNDTTKSPDVEGTGDQIPSNTSKTDDVEKKQEDDIGLGIQVVDTADTPISEVPTSHAFESPSSTVHAETPITPNTSNTLDLAQPPDAQGSVEIADGDQTMSSFGKPLESNPSRSHLEDKRPVTSPDFGAAKPSFVPPMLDSDSAELRLPLARTPMTDRYAFNGGRPASEHLHGSTEDVPSLSSTVSTATGNVPRNHTGFHARTVGDRPGSISTSVPPRSSGSITSKRSSLVSFTKLISGSVGERSKLSHEQKVPQDEPERARKKGHRFSRVLHFWKSKEKDKMKETPSQ